MPWQLFLKQNQSLNLEAESRTIDAQYDLLLYIFKQQTHITRLLSGGQWLKYGESFSDNLAMLRYGFNPLWEQKSSYAHISLFAYQ